MSTFEARLRFQKTVYLLQAFGINRGYDFSWYLRGPHCSLAAHDGYGLRGVYDLIPGGGPPFKSARANGAFKKFCHFIYGKEIDELEIAASLHYLKRSEQWDDERVKKAVEDKQDRFTRKMVDREWDDMEANGLHLRRRGGGGKSLKPRSQQYDRCIWTPTGWHIHPLIEHNTSNVCWV